MLSWSIEERDPSDFSFFRHYGEASINSTISLSIGFKLQSFFYLISCRGHFPLFPIGRWAIFMNFSRQRKEVWQLFCSLVYLYLSIVLLIAPIRTLYTQLSKFSVIVLTNKMCCSPVESIPCAAIALDSRVNRESNATSHR